MASPEQDLNVDLTELKRDYIIRRELGRGGMGVVYLGRHKTAGHDAAIKIIDSKYVADADSASRFAREARLAARIQHPNIVRHYEMRKLARGHIALIMQYVPGETLGEVLQRREQLRFDEVQRILSDVGRGLQHAHSNGVVHRDVKPANIFIDRESNRALLSDFGIAKAMTGDADLTHTGMTIGTPTYMAPEQIDGRSVDGRADIYSLGIVAWEMLSGKRPWEGENLYSIIQKQKTESLAPITLLRPDTPQRFLLALEGALDKDPNQRWASASDFVEQLGQDTPTTKMIRRREELAKLLGKDPASAPTVMDGATAPFRRTQDTPVSGTVEGTPVKPERKPPAPASEIAQARRKRLMLAIGAGGAVLLIAVTILVMTLTSRSASTSAAATTRPAPVAPDTPATATATATPPPVDNSTPPAIPGVPVPDRSVPGAKSPYGDALARARVESASDSAIRAASVPPEKVTQSATFATMAQVRYASKQPEAAHALIDSALARNRLNADAYALRARLDMHASSLRDAWADAEVAGRLGLGWESQTLAAMIEARLANTRAARDRLAPLMRSVKARGGRVPLSEATSLARALIALGDNDKALDVLEGAVANAADLRTALADPEFDGIRTSDRFRALLRRPLERGDSR
jgi:serine/threonine protein kinase